ncbi:MAG: hypothetical protein ABI175_15225 [Polyangiales bacterium]
MLLKTAADSSMGSPLYAVQHDVSPVVAVGGVPAGLVGKLVLVVVVVLLIGLIVLGCGPPF